MCDFSEFVAGIAFKGGADHRKIVAETKIRARRARRCKRQATDSLPDIRIINANVAEVGSRQFSF
jgi:hypothetical protein